MELWFTMENYGTMEKNYGTMDKTMVLYWELWNFNLRRRKHVRLPKTKKLWFIMEKTKEIYQTNWSFEQNYSFRTLIYYGKTMVLWKKLWYYTENYGTLIYYGKNYGTMEKTMVL